MTLNDPHYFSNDLSKSSNVNIWMKYKNVNIQMTFQISKHIIQTSQNQNSECPNDISKCPNDFKGKNESQKETFIINEYIHTANNKNHIYLK